MLILIDGFVPEVCRLDDDEALTCLTFDNFDALLAVEPLTGGLEARLGEHHLRALTIVGFPMVSFADLFDELNRLAFGYRWSTRAIKGFTRRRTSPFS